MTAVHDEIEPRGPAAPPRVRLRPVQVSDEPFLLRLYASTRVDELAPLPWSDAEKGAFVEMQFRAQSAHYAKHYATAERSVVLVDGTPAGRLYVWRSAAEIRVVDVSVLPSFRERGVGTALLTALAEEGDEAQIPLSIHVELGNRARRLYERLGFVEAEDKGAYLFMRRAPQVSSLEPATSALEVPWEGAVDARPSGQAIEDGGGE